LGAPGGCFQFLGIPTKGELSCWALPSDVLFRRSFPISRDPPEGGTLELTRQVHKMRFIAFPISRDPPEGGTMGG